MSSAKKLLEAAAGTAAGGAGLDIAEVFSTYLYAGNSGTLSVNNGIDLSGEGGLLWIKCRDNAQDHMLIDTARGGTKYLNSNAATGEQTFSSGEQFTFSSTGFSSAAADFKWNNNQYDYASWSFRKAEKFFDVVTYSGGNSAQTIAHNLGSTPAMMIVKQLNSSGRWTVYHKDGSPTGNPQNGRMALNTTDQWYEYPGISSFANLWNQTAPTSTHFTVGTDATTGANGSTYVAYLFAHNNNDGEFGPDGDQDIISCGSFTGNTSAGVAVTLGWEPQFLLFKGTANSSSWYILDKMRGITYGEDDIRLNPDQNYYETQGNQYNIANLTATGFIVEAEASSQIWGANKVIYMAIRAPMMTEPEAATDVFDVALRSATSAYSVGFPTDLWIGKETTRAAGAFVSDRLRGGKKYLLTPTNGSEQTDNGGIAVFDLQDSFSQGAASQPLVNWNWKRAKGYFDVVCYTGTGANRTVAHSLGVVPEMMWIKKRSGSYEWIVYSPKGDGYLRLNTNEVYADSSVLWNDTDPTSTVFSLGEYGHVNGSGETYVAYLFATLAGISKLGTVSHSGSSTDVNCGFSNGARFVILKRTDAAGDWYIWDSVRGIVAGNDPYLLLNSTAAEVTNTDYIDPLSSGFQISGDLTDGDYIFYAIA